MEVLRCCMAGEALFAPVFGLGSYLFGNQLARLTGPFLLGAAAVAVGLGVTLSVYVRRNMKRLELGGTAVVPTR